MPLTYPPTIDPTPPDDRNRTRKFDTSFSRTKSDVADEFRRMGVEEWRIEDEVGSDASPGIILRWTKNGQEHAVVADEYTTKKDNLREAYLWLKETRMREKRKARTAQDAFAAAQLPSGNEDDTATPLSSGTTGLSMPPHEVLSVPPTASNATIRQAYRERVKDLHPDTDDGDRERFKELNTALEAMIE